MDTITAEKTYTPIGITVALALFVGGSVIGFIGPIVSYASRLTATEVRQESADLTQKALLEQIRALNEKQSTTNERLSELIGAMDRTRNR